MGPRVIFCIALLREGYNLNHFLLVVLGRRKTTYCFGLDFEFQVLNISLLELNISGNCSGTMKQVAYWAT